MKSKANGTIQKWSKKINWAQRVKAVCKPCWELKYCPYGPLVERFPLHEARTHRSCRIFGHECPVFKVAEPFTETKELRNISRHIPRPIQFRVLKRENQVCRVCGMPVQAEDVHFDHIIPWSKGGPTEESNIQLLCGDCNRKKSSCYEGEFLVSGLNDHLNDPIDASIILPLLFLASFRHDFVKRNSRLPKSVDIANETNKGKKGAPEEYAEQTISDLEMIFKGKRTGFFSKPILKALELRWGYRDNEIRKLNLVSKETGIPLEDLVQSEIELVEKLGWRVKDSPYERKKWSRT
jgi:hypothetical protein